MARTAARWARMAATSEKGAHMGNVDSETATEGAQPTPDSPLLRVLLVEDNIGFAYFVRDLLTRRNTGRYALEHAGTLSEGLAVLRRGSIDIILLDLGLPDQQADGHLCARSQHVARDSYHHPDGA